MGVSLNPETFIGGGGFKIDDVDAKIIDAKFLIYDYGNPDGPKTPALWLHIDVEGTEYDQYYSMGNIKDWLPTPDGKSLDKVGERTAIDKTANGALFLKSLVEVGFPPEELGKEEISVLNGLVAHFIQAPAPERNIKKSPEQIEKDRKFPPTILLIDRIVKLPDGTTMDGGDNTANDDIEKTAESCVIGAILDNAGKLPYARLVAHVYQNYKGPDPNKIMSMANKTEFLAAIGRPWKWNASEQLLTMP